MVEIWLESVRTALQVLMAHRLRSFLTALTVAVGAGAIALMSSLASSAILTVTSGIDAVGGRDLLMVYPRTPKHHKGTSDKILSFEDAEVLRDRVPGVVGLDYLTSLPGQTITAGNKKASVDLGIGSAYRNYVSQRVGWGTDLPPDSERSSARVLLLSEAVAKQLFGSPQQALRRDVLLWGHRYRVVGVTKGEPSAGFDLGDISASRAVFVGTPVILKDEGWFPGGSAVLRLARSADHERAVRVANAILLHRHRGIDDFELFDLQRFLSEWDDIFMGLRVITGIIAAVSLVIAGAGVSNVILASVRQRVTEIGIRRALGASADDIRRQFLIESMLLSFLGGVVGALGGAVMALSVGVLAGKAIPGWQAEVSAGATLVAMATAVTFGWGFGVRPARRAAGLDIIECLRGAGW